MVILHSKLRPVINCHVSVWIITLNRLFHRNADIRSIKRIAGILFQKQRRTTTNECNQKT